MNKKCFRVIFSKTLGRLVVTSELAKAEGKSTEQSSFGISQLVAQIRPLTFSLFCALGFVTYSSSALADLIIQADKSAPKNQQPIVLQTANGLPQVNIQTPNEKGLSHNKYSKFDVDTKGAILNNSRTHTQTQQAGMVAGNPYLARGEAKVILNEVNSSDPSVLKGYVEVAGKKAKVIIANPSGIHCDGCGVINSDRATLTTGKPKIQNGNLDSFVVEKGKVKVSGKGMDNSRVDYTEILARETELNAGVWSKKETKVVTGKNTIKRSENGKDLQIVHTNQPLAEETKPQFAVDVGELGGMYSGKIHLIGTEEGVGVRNAGHLGASAETVKIDSRGRIVNTGVINAQETITLTGEKGVENRGKIENRRGDIQLVSNKDVQQDGAVVARNGNIQNTAKETIRQQGESVAKGHIHFQAPKVETSTQSLIAAGVEVQSGEKGEVRLLETRSAQGKNITVNASDKATLQGRQVASGKLEVASQSVDLNQSQSAAYAIDVKAKKGDIQANHAALIADKTLTLNTPETLSTQNSTLKAEKIRTQQRALNSQHATWEQTGTETLTLNVAEQFQNQGGTFKTQGDLVVNAKGMDNQKGRLLSNGKLILDTGKETLNSREGTLAAAQHIEITSGKLINDDGAIQSYGSSQINAAEVTNHRGQVRAAEQLTLHTDKLSQQTGLIAAGVVEMTTQTLQSNQQSEISGNQIKVNAQQLDNRESKLIARQQATLDVQQGIQNQQGILASLAGDLNINTHQSTLDNTQGMVAAQQGNLTLNTQSLINQQGVVRAHSANITTQQLDNRNTLADKTQGIVATHLTLQTAQLENQLGRITATDKATLKADTFQNQAGEILVAQQGQLKAQHINNQAGWIASTAGSLAIETQTALDNQQGNIGAKTALHLDTQGLNNQQGSITAGELTLNSHNQAVNNQEGTLFASQKAVLNTGNIENQQGIIRSAELNVNAKGQHINNQAGEIGANIANIVAQQLDNQAGVIKANHATITADSLNNRAISESGSLVSADNLTLNLAQLDNQGTKAKETVPTQGIQAKQFTLNANQLANQQGGIYSSENVTLNVAERVDNQQGELLALNKVDIQNQDKLMLNNQEGMIQGHQQVNLNLKGIEAEGTIKTAGDLSVNLKESFTLNKAFEVGNNLTFKTEGNFVNNAVQAVGNSATFTAQHITNQANAEISGANTTLNAQSITNRGLIDGGKVLLNSSTVTNIGTGRIYGDHLAFKGKVVENLAETVDGETKSATIAARERLDFGVEKIINRDNALILSLGETAIGNTLDENNHATGKAELIQNDSATIEFLGGANLGVKQILNRDTHVKTRIRTEKEHFSLYGKEDRATETVSEWYRNGVDGKMDHADGQRRKTARFEFNDKSKPNITTEQGEFWQRKEYDQTREIPESYDEAPAKFLVGGTLRLNTDKVLNQYSQLLIGDKLYLNEQLITKNEGNANLGNSVLINEDLEAIKTITNEGTYYRYKQERKRPDWHSRRRNFLTEKVTDKINEPFEELVRFNKVLNTIGTPLNTSDVKVEDRPLVKDIALDTVSINTTNNVADIRLTPEIDAQSQNQVIGSGQVFGKLETSIDNLDPSKMGELKMPLVRTYLENVRLPEASLYKINPDAPSGFVVETDPRFANKRQWLSSDYMFDQLRNNHDNVHKRLGDGFYEQRLVNEQVHQLTGRRFIEGYQNDLEQYKALMNNGIKYAKDFNLSVGVGLTAKQMSELTTDMVWLVNKEVTLADGRKVTVLVPQVYLVARDSDITSHGAVISANQIIGNVHTVDNSGVIAGRDVARLNSYEVQNRGTIAANVVDIATERFRQLGGKTQAVENLTVFANQSLEIESTLSNATSRDGNFSRAMLDKTASLSVTGKNGEMNLLSNGDITVKAANLESEGKVNIDGKRVNITTLQTHNKEHYNGDADNYYRLDQQAEVGSAIAGKTGVSVISDTDNTLRQASLSSENGLVEVGSREGNVTIEAGRAEEQLATSSKSTSKGLFSKTTTINRHYHDNREAVGSNLEGEHIHVWSNNGDVLVKGSNLLGDKGVEIDAKNNATVTADTNYFKDVNQTERKKSGLMGSGGIGFTIGKKSEKHEYESEGWTQSDARSVVGSQQGNIRISAGNHAQVTGTDLITPRTQRVDIIGSSTKVEASKDIIETKENHEYKQSGFTIALSSSVTDAVMDARQSVRRGSDVKSDKLKALYAMKAADDAYRAVEATGELSKTLDSLMDGTMQNNGAGENPSIKVSVSYGSQKTVERKSGKEITHSKSNISTGELNVKARDGKAVFEGVDAEASTIRLAGKQGIEVKGVKDEKHQRTENKSSGGSVGVFVGASNGSYGFGVEGSVNVAKGKSNLDSEHWQNSVFNADKIITDSEEGGLTLDAANFKTKRWEGDIQNLTLTSRQDTEKYSSKQTSAKASGSVAYGSGGAASVAASYSKAKVDYAQVNQQTGIDVGEGGMNVTVHNHSQLDGAFIDSKATAENNRFKTKSIGYRNIENHSEIKTESASVSAGSGGINPMQAISSALSLLGNGNESATSQTKAAIGQNIQIETETPENLNGLSRDVANANQKVDKQDLDKLKENQEAAQVAGELFAKYTGTIAQKLGLEDGSKEKVALHALAGALSAKMSGGDLATGAAAGATSEWINTEVEQYLKENQERFGLTLESRKQLQQASALVLGAMAGAVVGDDTNAVLQGAQTSYNAETYNRQLHPKEIDWIRDNAQRFADAEGISLADAEEKLIERAAKKVDDLASIKIDSDKHRDKNQAADDFLASARNGYFTEYDKAKFNSAYENAALLDEYDKQNDGYYSKRLQPLIKNTVVGYAKEQTWNGLKSYGEALADNPIETLMNTSRAGRNGFHQAMYCLKEVDCMKEKVSVLIGAISDYTQSSISNRYLNPAHSALNNLYGYDVSHEVGLLSTARGASNVLEVTSVSKMGTSIIRGTVNSPFAVNGQTIVNSGKAMVESGSAFAKKAISELPDLRTGQVVGHSITNLEDLHKALPKGYEYVSPIEVQGPKGGMYYLVARDSNGNAVYFNNGTLYSFEGSKKSSLTGNTPKIETASNLTKAKPQEGYDQKYKWLLDEKAKNANEKPGFTGEVKIHSGNDYFKYETEWQASQNGTGLKYRVYQQEIDLDLKPIPGNPKTNLELMKEGKAPYVIKNGKAERVELHHSRQNGKGAIYESSALTHTGNTNTSGRKAIHPYHPEQHPQFPVERKLFNKDKGQYWIDRANAIKRGRNEK